MVTVLRFEELIILCREKSMSMQDSGPHGMVADYDRTIEYSTEVDDDVRRRRCVSYENVGIDTPGSNIESRGRIHSCLCMSWKSRIQSTA